MKEKKIESFKSNKEEIIITYTVKQERYADLVYTKYTEYLFTYIILIEEWKVNYTVWLEGYAGLVYIKYTVYMYTYRGMKGNLHSMTRRVCGFSLHRVYCIPH